MDKTSSLPGAPSRSIGLTDFALILMTVIWGLNFIVVKSTLNEINPLAFVSSRFFIGSVLFFVIVFVREHGFQIPRREWGKLLLVGVVGTTIYQPLYITGLSLTTASNTALILAGTPAVIVLLNRFLRGERFERRGWLGIVLSFLGIALIVASGGNLLLDRSTMLGDGLVVVAMLFWSMYSVLTAPLLKMYSSLSVTALSTILGSIPLVILSIPALLAQNWAAVSVSGWSGLVYSAVLAIVVAYIIWNFGVQKIGGARTAIYNNLTPVVATLAAAVFLGETLSLLKVVGAAIIFFGLYLARSANMVIEPEG